MFEDQQPKPIPVAEPKDMFDGPPANLPMGNLPPPPPTPVMIPPVNTGQPHGVAPTAPSPIMPMTPEIEAHHPSGIKSALMVIGGLIVVALAGLIAYKLIVAPKAVDPVVLPVEEPVIEEPVPVVAEPEPVVEEEPVAVDSDGDGLTDDEESKIGTDPRLPDTDKDGLGDKEEAQVYGTDPLDPDTDDDNYLDGQEVAAGFNPNGDGKLFEVPR